MNLFEKGPNPKQLPKQLNEESLEKVEEKKEGLEDKEDKFEIEPALQEEESILGRFRGKAKTAARVMVVISLLSIGLGIVKETHAHAQEAQPLTKSEEVEQEKQEEEKEEEKIEINEANLTASSMWSGNIIESARNDMDKIKTAEDAEWLVRSYFNQFVSEYYMPTKGNLKEGPYGIKMRDYSEDDSKFLLQNAQEMKELLQELNEKFGIEAYEKRMEQIDDMITKLERQSSYVGQKQKEVLERLEKMLQQP